MTDEGAARTEEADKAPERTRAWVSVAAYVLLGALLLVLVRPEPVTSYNIGRSAGLLIMSILVSYGIWSLIRRTRGSREKWSPWILLIAFFVVTPFKVASQSGERLAGRPTARPSATVSMSSPGALFSPLEALRYGPIPPATLRGLQQTYASDPAASEALLDVDGRLVFEGRRQVGAVTAAFSKPDAVASPDFQTGFFDGFSGAIEEGGGGPVVPHRVDGLEARGGPTELGYSVSFIVDNAAITVLGGDRRTAMTIARGIVQRAEDA